MTNSEQIEVKTAHGDFRFAGFHWDRLWRAVARLRRTVGNDSDAVAILCCVVEEAAQRREVEREEEQARAAMSDEELFRALDGLRAYDDGATDSGIRDEELRARVKAHLTALPDRQRERTVARFLREHHFSDWALEQGYGIEDAEGFLEWLRDDMGVEV